MGNSVFENGSREDVLCLMAEYAIRDQEALIEALTPNWSRPDRDTAKAIKHAESCIRDFKKFRSLTRKN